MSDVLKIIAFGTVPGAEALKKTSWIATVRQAVDSGETAQDAEKNLVTDLTGYTDDQIAALRILGHLNGQLITDNGSTIDYSLIEQAYEVEPARYWIPAPLELEAGGYIDLSAYTIIDLPPEWEPPFPFE